MNYCSHCGSQHLKRQIPEGDTLPRWVCSQCLTIHYENPRLVVGCLAVSGDKVLLCRRAIEPAYGKWNLPAGFLENGETVADGALRELWEEAEARMKIERLHCVFDLPQTKHVYMHFLGELSAKGFGCGVESLEVRLFSEKEIPWKEIAFSSSVFALKKYFEGKRSGFKGCHLGFHEGKPHY